MDKRDERKGRSPSDGKDVGPTRQSKPGTESEQDKSFQEGQESKGSSSRELGEGGERESLEKKSSEEETDIDVSMGRGQYGGQEGQGRGAPGAGA